MSKLLSPIVSSASKVYTDFAFEPTNNKSWFSRFLAEETPKAQDLAKVLGSSNALPLKEYINDVRNLKSDAEIANMRKVGKASGRAYTEAMRQAWTQEKDLAAFLDYKFKANDCDGSAYIPVVAGGQVNLAAASIEGNLN